VKRFLFGGQSGKLHGKKFFQIPIGAGAVRVVENQLAGLAADLEIARALEGSDSTFL
jgi:hypothetical protein